VPAILVQKEHATSIGVFLIKPSSNRRRGIKRTKAWIYPLILIAVVALSLRQQAQKTEAAILNEKLHEAGNQ
jgi:hypothetical protein